jgi:hypothetical protein
MFKTKGSVQRKESLKGAKCRCAVTAVDFLHNILTKWIFCISLLEESVLVVELRVSAALDGHLIAFSCYMFTNTELCGSTTCNPYRSSSINRSPTGLFRKEQASVNLSIIYVNKPINKFFAVWLGLPSCMLVFLTCCELRYNWNVYIIYVNKTTVSALPRNETDGK